MSSKVKRKVTVENSKSSKNKSQESEEVPRRPSVFERLGTVSLSLGLPSQDRHSKADALEKCHNWLRTGNCSYGETCRYQHGPYSSGTRGKSEKKDIAEKDLRHKVKSKREDKESVGGSGGGGGSNSPKPKSIPQNISRNRKVEQENKIKSTVVVTRPRSSASDGEEREKDKGRTGTWEDDSDDWPLDASQLDYKEELTLEMKRQQLQRELELELQKERMMNENVTITKTVAFNGSSGSSSDSDSGSSSSSSSSSTSSSSSSDDSDGEDNSSSSSSSSSSSHSEPPTRANKKEESKFRKPSEGKQVKGPRTPSPSQGRKNTSKQHDDRNALSSSRERLKRNKRKRKRDQQTERRQDVPTNANTLHEKKFKSHHEKENQQRDDAYISRDRGHGHHSPLSHPEDRQRKSSPVKGKQERGDKRKLSSPVEATLNKDRKNKYHQEQVESERKRSYHSEETSKRPRSPEEENEHISKRARKMSPRNEPSHLKDTSQKEKGREANRQSKDRRKHDLGISRNRRELPPEIRGYEEIPELGLKREGSESRRKEEFDRREHILPKSEGGGRNSRLKEERDIKDRDFEIESKYREERNSRHGFVASYRGFQSEMSLQQIGNDRRENWNDRNNENRQRYKETNRIKGRDNLDKAKGFSPRLDFHSKGNSPNPQHRLINDFDSHIFEEDYRRFSTNQRHGGHDLRQEQLFPPDLRHEHDLFMEPNFGREPFYPDGRERNNWQPRMPRDLYEPLPERKVGGKRREERVYHQRREKRPVTPDFPTVLSVRDDPLVNVEKRPPSRETKLPRSPGRKHRDSSPASHGSWDRGSCYSSRGRDNRRDQKSEKKREEQKRSRERSDKTLEVDKGKSLVKSCASPLPSQNIEIKVEPEDTKKQETSKMQTVSSPSPNRSPKIVTPESVNSISNKDVSKETSFSHNNTCNSPKVPETLPVVEEFSDWSDDEDDQLLTRNDSPPTNEKSRSPEWKLREDNQERETEVLDSWTSKEGEKGLDHHELVDTLDSNSREGRLIGDRSPLDMDEYNNSRDQPCRDLGDYETVDKVRTSESEEERGFPEEMVVTDSVDYDPISDDELEALIEEPEDEEAKDKEHIGGIVNALDVDWSSLMNEQRPKLEFIPGSARKRFTVAHVLSRIGFSEAFAGVELTKRIIGFCEKQLQDEVAEENHSTCKKKLFSLEAPVASFHVLAAQRKHERETVVHDVGPYRRALCARRDLQIRRLLCRFTTKMADIPSVSSSRQQCVDKELYRLSVNLFKKSKEPITPAVDVSA
ncbi:uncharacterized protein LOC143247919 [Tachypleus tridentatus]|uniref:uncharacterized protein LOC143247919 n=1 Tax=Tachypleus tridentatus TaxID=6853 RepID=UPI003FD45A95